MTYMTRTTFQGQTRALQLRLSDAYNRLTDVNDRIASGKAFRRASEAPVEASQAAMLQEHLDHLDAVAKSATDASSRLNVTDAKLQQASDLYARLKQLVVQASTATTGAAGRQAIAQEVVQIRDSLVAVANAEYLGQPLFAGISDQPAVVLDGGGIWQFTGDASDVIERRITPSESLRVNVTAAEVFQAGGTDMFTMLDELAGALQTDDADGIRAAHEQLEDLRQAMSAAQAQIGAAANRVEVSIARNASTNTTITAQLSQVRDIDLAEAVTTQAMLDAAYRAALGVTGRAGNLSLLDFLR